jgi:hypothetical protein
LLNNIFKLVESENQISDSDSTFLIDLVKKYKLSEGSAPEIQDTIFRIGMHQTLLSWEQADDFAETVRRSRPPEK